MRKVYFIDIDGTILEHLDNWEDSVRTHNYIPTIGDAAKKLFEWHCQGHFIVLTTGRAECLRNLTITQLYNANITYDILLMNVGCGQRILINDYTEETGQKAFAYNVKRNVEGIDNIP